MLRRGFLKTLGAGWVVATALPLLLPGELEELLKPVNKIFLPPANGWVSSQPDVILPATEQLFDMAFYGTTTSSIVSISPEPVIVRVVRSDSGLDILNFAMNANGGIVRWIAVPGEEIYGPVKIIKPASIDAILVGRDKAGQLVSDHNGARVPMLPPQPSWSSAVNWEAM